MKTEQAKTSRKASSISYMTLNEKNRASRDSTTWSGVCTARIELEKTKEKMENDSPTDARGKDDSDYVRTMDQSQLMAIQELMVDMSVEERQKFMDQIHSQVNNDGRLDADVFYRHGQDVNSFIRETDERERLDNKFPRQAIPLGPQGEDDS